MCLMPNDCKWRYFVHWFNPLNRDVKRTKSCIYVNCVSVDILSPKVLSRRLAKKIHISLYVDGALSAWMPDAFRENLDVQPLSVQRLCKHVNQVAKVLKDPVWNLDGN